MLRIPGTPASAAYCDEIYAMTQKGERDLELGVNLVFSVIGGLIGVAVLDRLRAGARRIRDPFLVVRVFLAGAASA